MQLACYIVAIVLFLLSAYPAPPDTKWYGSLVPLGLTFFAGAHIVPA
jgi:hypothetical protein